VLQFGTVLRDGEDYDAPRVLAAVGPAAAAAYHGFYEWSPSGVDGLPGGAAWRERVEAEPERTRHLTLHAGHMLSVTDRDRALLDRETIATWTFTGTAAQLRERMNELAAAGATELALQPGGPDIEAELRAFAELSG
jgi:5,10-methylenetetrahydromethanopterin reductase